MPRLLSPAATASILARETAEVWLAALRITHPDLTAIRLVNNNEPVTRADGVYQPWPFTAVLPDDTSDANQSVRLVIDSIDRSVLRAIRGLRGPRPQAVLEVILASSPDTVEMGPFEFAVLGADYDELQIEASVGYEEDFLNQAVPAQTYTPQNSPGLWP